MWKDLVARDLTGPDASIPLQGLLGERAPPAIAKGDAALVLPLDADGSQAAAVSAAAAGSSFVIQGPPGTGKSQTIANLLVQCASQGMSVLVVSDRIAALEAVHKRLASVGLAEVCAIAGQPIERVSRPHVNAPAGAAVGRTRLAEVAATLDAHVAAMHGNSLGFTVLEVMARLVELRTSPRAALAEAAQAVEPIAAHPWRTSALAAWNGDGTIRAKLALEPAGEAAWAVASALVEVGKLVPGIVARTPEQLKTLGLLAQLAACSPRPVVELLSA